MQSSDEPQRSCRAACMQMAYVQGRFEELVGSESGSLAELPASVLLELLQSEALAMSSELTALKARGAHRMLRQASMPANLLNCGPGCNATCDH